MLSPRWLGLLAKLLDMNGETRQIPRQDVLAILHSINSILLSKWRSFRAKINPTALSEVLQGETQPHFTKSPQTQTQPPHSPNILLQYLWRVLVNFEWGNQKIQKSHLNSLQTQIRKGLLFQSPTKDKPLSRLRLLFDDDEPLPIRSMYGIYTYVYHQKQLNEGKYTIHGWYGLLQNMVQLVN